MNLIRRDSRNLWEPFDIITDWQEEMNRLFSGSLRRRTREDLPSFFRPDIDLEEDDEQFVVIADVPGIRKEELDISITGNVVTIKGERKEESEKEGKNFYHAERWAGGFTRVIELPGEVDASKVKASVKDGILELTIPKSDSAKPKQIKVDIK